jgi:hypothetical protein
MDDELCKTYLHKNGTELDDSTFEVFESQRKEHEEWKKISNLNRISIKQGQEESRKMWEGTMRQIEESQAKEYRKLHGEDEDDEEEDSLELKPSRFFDTLQNLFKPKSRANLDLLRDIDTTAIQTLEECLHNLHIIPSTLRIFMLTSCKAFAEKNYAKLSHMVTVEQAMAIHLYTKEIPGHKKKCMFYLLNRLLRTEDLTQLRPFFPYIKLLLSALERLPRYNGG